MRIDNEQEFLSYFVREADIHVLSFDSVYKYAQSESYDTLKKIAETIKFPIIMIHKESKIMGATQTKKEKCR